eukprot:Hpha_TRINITY_DN6910_c0_g1::TRINITY_DN6910_c0_g1_i1::g.139562::m.139562
MPDVDVAVGFNSPSEPLGVDYMVVEWQETDEQQTITLTEVVVAGVVPGGMWERYGLPTGVAIRELAGVEIRTVQDLRRAVDAARKQGQGVRLRCNDPVSPQPVGVPPPPPPRADEMTLGGAHLAPAPQPPGPPIQLLPETGPYPGPPHSGTPEVSEDAFEKPPQWQRRTSSTRVRERTDPRAVARAVMSAFDSDRDGVLNQEEFDSFIAAIGAHQTRPGAGFSPTLPSGYNTAAVAQDVSAVPEGERRHIMQVCMSLQPAREALPLGPHLSPEKWRPITPRPTLPAGVAPSPYSGPQLVSAAGFHDAPVLLPTGRGEGPRPSCWGETRDGLGGRRLVVNLETATPRELRVALVRLGRALEGRLDKWAANQRRVAAILNEVEAEAVNRFGCGLEALLDSAARRPDVAEWAHSRMQRACRDTLPLMRPAGP